MTEKIVETETTTSVEFRSGWASTSVFVIVLAYCISQLALNMYDIARILRHTSQKTTAPSLR